MEEILFTYKCKVEDKLAAEGKQLPKVRVSSALPCPDFTSHCRTYSMTSQSTGSTVPRTEPSLWTLWTAARNPPALLGSPSTRRLRGGNTGRAGGLPGYPPRPSTGATWGKIKQKKLTRINRTEDTHRQQNISSKTVNPR